MSIGEKEMVMREEVELGEMREKRVDDVEELFKNLNINSGYYKNITLF